MFHLVNIEFSTMPHPPTETQQFDKLTFHPYKILLFLTLGSLTAIFLGLTLSYLYSRVQTDIPPIQVSNIFIFNTLILMASSATISWANKAYLKDNTRQYQIALAVTIVLTFLFMIMQYVAWNDMMANNRFINSDNATSYLYIISGLHFAHIIGGLPFIILFFITAVRRMQEPVSVLVYFSDPEKRLKLRLLTFYWHFLDVLWIYLVVFFTVVYFVFR